MHDGYCGSVVADDFAAVEGKTAAEVVDKSAL